MSRNVPEPGAMGSDWISRVTVPDLYPRKSDPFRPAGAQPPPGLPPDLEDNQEIADFFATLTAAGGRPPVYARAMNLTVNVNTAPVPLINQQTPVDTIVVDVYSTAAASVFFGFGSGVTVTSGVEVRPGNPLVFSPDNTREQWELQKPLEMMAALMASQFNMPALGAYRAPRVVLDASDYFLVAAGAVSVAVMLFYVPEQQ